MRPEDLPEQRRPIGQSPRWITIHALGGLAAVLVVIALYALPDGTEPAVHWAQAIVPVLVLASLARGYAARRRTMTSVETGYLRMAVVLLTIAGIPGTIPLSLPVGVAFLAWTVVEKRRARV